MTVSRREVIVYAALAAALGVVLLVLVIEGPRWLATPVSDTPPEAAVSEARKIRVRLFYVAEDGARLVPVEQEVLFGEGTDEQAKRIVEAQLGVPSGPLASAIPPGTQLRGVFLTSKGEAFVDLSVEAMSAHPSGTTNELFTVYSIVNALTVNLPAISGVQILIDGKEVDTLAGHLDMRRPLEQDLRWVVDQ